MAFIIKDRVKEGTTSTGTGDVSLGGAAATFDTFQSYMTNGDTTYYAIVHTTSGTDEWEVGLGTWNTGNTLTRTTVLAGSNGTSAVNFSSGTKDVFMTYPAAHAALAGDDVNFANITVTGTVDGRDVAADGTKLDTVETNADVTDTVNVAAAGALMKSGGTMTGNLILNADPTTALGAATKEYVDTIAAAGIHYHTPVRVETPSALTASYDNGTSGVGATLTNSGTQAALVIDGVTVATNDRVLVYNQTNAAHNGIYTVTNTGSSSTNWVLTRATDADSYGVSDPDAFGEGDAFFVKEGDTGAGELYVMNTSGTITFGTTAINFTVIAETAVYSAGTGMSLDGTTFSIGQDVGTTDNVTFNQVTAAIIGNVTGNLTGDVTGNADTATALETARTIQLSGDVTGSATFDGTANVTITAAVQDDSHAHVISNVDGLQAALDAKADDTTTITAGNGLTGGGSLGANRTLNVGAGGGITVSADAVAHADTSSQASVDNSGNTFIQDVTLDTYGHVTGLTSSTVTVGDATITVTSGGGLTGSGDFTTNQGTNETITLSHADTSSQASVNNSGRTYIQDITLDTYGHITGITSATETVTNTNQLTTFQVEDGDGTEVTISHGKEWKFVEGGGVNIDWTDTDPGSDADPYDLTFTINTGVTAGSGLTGGGTLNANRTISHADTSSQASVNNSNGTVIQDVTLDGFGHVTSLASVNLDGRYYTETEADSRFVNVTGDTMTGTLNLTTNNDVYRIGADNYDTNMTGLTVRPSDGANPTSGQALFMVRSGGGSPRFFAQHDGRTGTSNSDIYVGTSTDMTGGNRVFHDGYHPNSDKWTTARTLSLSGDASGSVSWDGSSNATLSVTVANDSHSHSNYLPKSGGTMTGALNMGANNITMSNSNITGVNSITINDPGEGIVFSGTTNITLYAIDDASDNIMNFSNAAELRRNNNKVWDAGNDGAGSGLDADLLDGYDSAENGASKILRTASNGYLNIYDWINVAGAGIFSSTNSAHFRPNAGSTYGAWQVSGSRNSWSGIYFDYAARKPHVMFDSSANGGFYVESGGRWPFYYHYDNNCIGIGGSTTSSGYRLRLNGAGIHAGNNNIHYVNELHFNDNVRFYDNGDDSYLNFKWADAGAGGIILRNSSGSAGIRLYGENSGAGGLLDNDGAWAVRIQTGTSPLELRCDNNTEFQVYSSYTRSVGSSRAPIFYDYNNTSYYTDPASTSVMNQINMYGGLVYDDSMDYDATSVTGLTSAPIRNRVDHNVGTTNTFVPVFKQTALYSSGYRTHLNVGLYKKASSWGDNDTGMYVALGGNDGYPTKHWKLTYGHSLYNSEGYVSTPGSFRAPIFYDSNDTSYYVNPASGSVLRGPITLHDNGSSSPLISINADDSSPWALRLYRDDLGAGTQVYLSNATTAYWQHTVQAGTDFRAPIFYDSNDTAYYTNPAGTTVLHRGYTTSWGVNRSGSQTSGDGLALYGNYGGGEPTYGMMFAGRGTFGGHGPMNGSDWATYFTMNNDTSRGWIFRRVGSGNSASITAAGIATFDSSVRSPIFYDNNNTSYYGDFASTSRFNLVHENYVGIGTAPNSSGYRLNMGGSIDMNNYSIDYVDQLHFNDGVRFVGMDNDNYLKFRWNDTGAGGIRFYDGNDTHHGYIYGDGSGRFGFLDQDGHWAVRIQTGTNPLELRCNNNVEFYVYTSYTLSPGSSRAPIFYDSNNTSYYVNPASTSTLNAIATLGDISAYTVLRSSGNTPFFENKPNVATNYTITNGYNAMSAGPITVNSGITVTIGDGEAWTIV